MVDINDVYDVYADSHDFLNRKKNLSVELAWGNKKINIIFLYYILFFYLK